MNYEVTALMLMIKEGKHTLTVEMSVATPPVSLVDFKKDMEAAMNKLYPCPTALLEPAPAVKQPQATLPNSQAEVQPDTIVSKINEINKDWFILPTPKGEKPGVKKERTILAIIACLDLIDTKQQGKYVMANLKSVMKAVGEDARIQNAINNASHRSKERE
jgi:hypothetical protein